MTMLTGPGITQPWTNAVVEPAAVAGGIVLGIDIGGTKTAAMVVDAADRVLGRAERPTDRQAPVRVAVEAARAAMTAAHLPMSRLEAVYAAADRGDPLAIRVTAAVAAAIGRAVRLLVLSYGVAKVVIGGGPSRAGEAFIRPLLRSLEDERTASALVRRAFLGAVEVLPPDSQPTSWGAITVARIGLHRTHAIDSERRQARPDDR